MAAGVAPCAAAGVVVGVVAGVKAAEGDEAAGEGACLVASGVFDGVNIRAESTDPDRCFFCSGSEAPPPFALGRFF